MFRAIDQKNIALYKSTT